MRGWRSIWTLNALLLLWSLMAALPVRADVPAPAPTAAPDPPSAEQPALSPSRQGNLTVRYGDEDLTLKVLESANGDCYVDLADPGLSRFFTLHGLSLRFTDGKPRTATMYAHNHYVHWAVDARRGLVDGKEAIWPLPVVVTRQETVAVSLRALAQLLDFRLRPRGDESGMYGFVARIEKMYLDSAADREVRLRATGPLDGANIETTGQTTTLTIPHAEWGFDTRDLTFGDVTVHCAGSGADDDPVTVTVTVPVQWKTESSGQILSSQMAVRVVPDFSAASNQIASPLGQPRLLRSVGDESVLIEATDAVQKLWRYDAEQHLLTVDVPNATIGSQSIAGGAFVTDIETEDLHTATFPFARIRVRLKDGYGFEVSKGEENRVTVRVAPMALLPVTTSCGGDLSPSASGSGLIVIDPGHGGGDPGAVSRHFGLREKDVTLDISLRLKASLEVRGFRVVMTRENDRDVSWAFSPDAVELGARTAVANTRNADLFVSIHCNSSTSSAHHGTELHWFKPADLTLAKALEGALENATGFTDKGIIRNRFFVLRHTTMPAVLVETAYLSNYTDAARLGDPAVRQRIADGLAEALAVRFTAARRQGISTRRP